MRYGTVLGRYPVTPNGAPRNLGPGVRWRDRLSFVHPLFEKEYRRRVRNAIDRSQELGAIEHNLLVGQLRELVVQELLKPISGPNIGFGTGKIVDHLGGQSDQIDVIVFDKSSMPPLAYGTADSSGLYPVEACIYAIEVKSVASQEEITDAVKKAASVDRLVYVPQLRVAGVPRVRVHNGLFAFQSNMTTDPINERDRWISSTDACVAPIALENEPNSFIELPALRIVCIAGRGYGYYVSDLRSFGWASATGEFDEILFFIAGVANTLAQDRITRSAPFGHYLLPGTAPPDQPPNTEDFWVVLLDLGRGEAGFDVEEATRYVSHRLRNTRGFGESVAHSGEILAAIREMEAEGELRLIEESPSRWRCEGLDSAKS